MHSGFAIGLYPVSRAPGILVHPGVPLRHLLPADLASDLIDVAHDNLLHTLPLEHLPRCGGLAAAADEDSFRVAVGEHRRVHLDA